MTTEQLQAYLAAAKAAKRCADASEFTCQFDEQMRKQHIPSLADAVAALVAEVERLNEVVADLQTDNDCLSSDIADLEHDLSMTEHEADNLRDELESRDA